MQVLQVRIQNITLTWRQRLDAILAETAMPGTGDVRFDVRGLQAIADNMTNPRCVTGGKVQVRHDHDLRDWLDKRLASLLSYRNLHSTKRRHCAKNGTVPTTMAPAPAGSRIYSQGHHYIGSGRRQIFSTNHPNS